MKEPPSLNFQETALSPELFCGMILREKTPRSLLSEIVAIYSGEVKWYSNRPFYRYGGHIEFIRFKEYYGMPRGMRAIQYTCISIYVRFSGQFFFKFSYKKIVMGKKDRCAVFGCNIDCLFPWKYTAKFPFWVKSARKY